MAFRLRFRAFFDGVTTSIPFGAATGMSPLLVHFMTHNVLATSGKVQADKGIAAAAESSGEFLCKQPLGNDAFG